MAQKQKMLTYVTIVRVRLTVSLFVFVLTYVFVCECVTRHARLKPAQSQGRSYVVWYALHIRACKYQKAEHQTTPNSKLETRLLIPSNSDPSIEGKDIYPDHRYRSLSNSYNPPLRRHKTTIKPGKKRPKKDQKKEIRVYNHKNVRMRGIEPRAAAELRNSGT